MAKSNPIDLMFAAMEKLGPGDNHDTLQVLGLLPQRNFQLIVDAGCGTGRQTIALAKALRKRIRAVDTYEPFLNDLRQRAVEAGVGELVETHCLDMAEIPQRFKNIDLLWSEGAAYNIGFANALSTWAAAIPAGRFAVVSELSWLRATAPEQVKQFFQACYPDMRSVPQNAAIAEKSGYNVLATHTLPTAAWVEGYYDVLEPRAKALVGHADASVRSFAEETLAEIDVFRQSDNSFGYVFYVLERT